MKWVLPDRLNKKVTLLVNKMVCMGFNISGPSLSKLLLVGYSPEAIRVVTDNCEYKSNSAFERTEQRIRNLAMHLVRYSQAQNGLIVISKRYKKQIEQQLERIDKWVC